MPDEMVKLMETVTDPKTTQAQVSAAYANCILSWDKGRLLHGSFWAEVNRLIIERWSERSLVRIKREAWRQVEQAETP